MGSADPRGVTKRWGDGELKLVPSARCGRPFSRLGPGSTCRAFPRDTGAMLGVIQAPALFRIPRLNGTHEYCRHGGAIA